MFQEQSSKGQSAISVLMVVAALCIWDRFYVEKTPDEKWAIWSVRFGIVFNLAVFVAVLYFR